jgi:hypothetical protein
MAIIGIALLGFLLLAVVGVQAMQALLNHLAGSNWLPCGRIPAPAR